MLDEDTFCLRNPILTDKRNAQSTDRHMSTYEVAVSTNINILVEAESEEEAMEIAMEVPNFGDFKADEAEVLSTIPADKLDRYKAHADGYYGKSGKVTA
jgi:hypothetical protein